MARMHHHTQQRGFISLAMLGLLVMILLVTGLGQYLWRSALNVGPACQNLVASWNLYELSDTCMAMGTFMASLRNQLESAVGATEFGDYMDLEEFSGMVARSFSSQTMGFNAPQLSGLIDTSSVSGGSMSFSGGSSLDKLRSALSQGSYGSSLMSSGNTGAGLGYLKSSAGMGEYGVLSQLSLGSAYGSGASGVGKDLGAARQYNSMALDSITKLQSSGSPEARQLLSALPGNPDDIARSLKSTLGQR